ncbi:MAG: hypothetical protein AAF065_02075 [Verrucomicrobiota bacterium]
MRFQRFFTILVGVFLAFAGISSVALAEKPLIRDFIGLNGHFHFKPELYAPTCRLVRNYHNINWDVATPGDPINFPVCVNKVNWNTVYGAWARKGFDTNVCLMFGSFGPPHRKDYQKLWRDNLNWAEDYGYEVARGLSNGSLATSIEIGNEPGVEFDDLLFQDVFTRIAKGVRRADPEMKIITCTAHLAQADKYHKDLRETFASPGIQELFDVISVHVYSEKLEKDQAHPWERSYPEDPEIDYLTRVKDVIAWRDAHVPEKEIWITEFGYDACTDRAMERREGWFEKLGWMGQTELQQAQWLVRSLLCFSALEVDRSYIYFYDDKDKASVHAASGLTRNFEPKPAYWAVKQFYELLGEYRLNRVIREEVGELYVYEYINDVSGLLWVLWSPTGHERSYNLTLRQFPSRKFKLYGMATTDGPAPSVIHERVGQSLSLEVGESPVYVRFD